VRAGLRGQCAGRWLPVCMCLCVFVCLCVNARWAERAVRWAMAACMYVFMCVCMFVCLWVSV